MVAIVGGRDFANQLLFDETLERFVVDYGMPSVVISGGAKGADTMAEKWAKKMKISMLIIKPTWRDDHGKYDKAAGIKRNTQIIAQSTHVIAFPTGGKGTEDSIKKAKKMNKILIIK